MFGKSEKRIQKFYTHVDSSSNKSTTIYFFQSIYAWPCTKTIWEQKFCLTKISLESINTLVKQEKKKFSKIYKRKPKDKLRQAFVTQILKISIKLQSQLSTKAEKTCFS